MLAFLRLVILPFRYARLTAYWVSTALSHPISLIVIAFFVWRSYYTPNGHDASGFVFTMMGYVGLIAFPASIIRKMTRPAPTPRISALPKEEKWPASAPVTIVVQDAPKEASPTEEKMWAKLRSELRDMRHV
jgi:hypothetical protein